MAALARIKGAASVAPLFPRRSRCDPRARSRLPRSAAVKASGQSAPRHGLLLSSLAAAPRAGRVDLPAWLGRRSGRPCSCHVRSRRNDRRGHSPRRYREVANSQLPSSCDDTLPPVLRTGQRECAALCAHDRVLAATAAIAGVIRFVTGKGHLPLPCVGAVTFDDFRDRVCWQMTDWLWAPLFRKPRKPGHMRV